MLQLSVVIPTLGGYELLDRVFAGLAEQDAAPGSFEVVVATDVAETQAETVERLLDDRPFAVRRVAGAVPGASANRNAGFAAARAPLVLFIDNDTIPAPGLVSEHLSWHAREPDETTGVLGLVRWAPELTVTTFMRWLDTGIQFDFANIEGTDAGWGRFVSANASVKRSFMGRVGGFDEQRFPYGYEDTDWAYRASKLGFRLLFNRRAVVDHLRTMDLEFWQKRARRVAAAERTFSELHPELPPWFHRLFTDAARQPPGRGRGLALAPFVPRGTPWLGERVWRSVDRIYKQALAPHFLAAWDEAARRGDAPAQPDLSEFATDSPTGASASGPK